MSVFLEAVLDMLIQQAGLGETQDGMLQTREQERDVSLVFFLDLICRMIQAGQPHCE